MGAIVLDASKINSYVLPNLTKTRSTMQDAYSATTTLKSSLPSSFSYRSVINDISNEIYKIRKEIKDIDKIIETKVERANNIQRKADSKVSSLSSAVAKIGLTAAGAVIGASTGKTVGAAVGAVTGAALAAATKKNNNTGAKESKSFFSKVGDFFKNACDGIKQTASKVVGGVKSAAKWVKDKTKTVVDWVADKFNEAKEWTCKALKDTGAWISKTAKSAWAWIKDAASTVWTHMKKIGATIVNLTAALTQGLVRLVESIVDLAFLVSACVDTINTGLRDIIKGIATGKWEWSATKSLWDKTKGIVAYDCTSKVMDLAYENKLMGFALCGPTGLFLKEADDNAYSWAKRDGLGFKICEGIGYIAGVVVISIFTFGAGGAALGAAAGTTASIGGVTISSTAVAFTAAAAGIGKYTEEEWNKNSLSITYGGQEVGLTIDYQKYCEIEKLGDGQSTTITQQFTDENGNPFELKFTITKNGDTYFVKDSNGNAVGFNGVTESSTVKGLGIGALKGLGDGLKAYTAVSTVGNLQSFTAMAKDLGGMKAVIKNFGYKQSFKSLAKNSAKQTFKDVGFYIDSGTRIYSNVSRDIKAGELDLLKTGAKIFGSIAVSYGINFLGNLGSNYLKTGVDKSIKELNKVKTLSAKEQSVLDFYNKQHPDEQFSTFDELKSQHPDIVSDITIDEYRIRVLDVNVEYDTRKTLAKELYEEEHGYGTFDKLPYGEQKSRMDSLDIGSTRYQEILSENIEYYTGVADDTILEVERLKKTGAIKDEYSTDDVIRMIEDDIPQTEYLTKEYIDDYYSKFNIKDGKATVVTFQNGDGKNFSNFKGQVGANDGMYVMPEKDAQEIINAALREDGTLDPAILKEKLGGVEFGDNVVVITQKVDASDLQMPKGSLSTAYVGQWKPGGMTTGGTVEAVIPPTKYLDTDDGFSITAYGPKTLDDYVKVIINGKK